MNMRIVNIDELLSDVESDAGKLIILYLSNVLVGSVDEISSRLNWTRQKTRDVCESLANQNVVTQIESDQTYAISKAVVR